MAKNYYINTIKNGLGNKLPIKELWHFRISGQDVTCSLGGVVVKNRYLPNEVKSLVGKFCQDAQTIPTNAVTHADGSIEFDFMVAVRSDFIVRTIAHPVYKISRPGFKAIEFNRIVHLKAANKISKKVARLFDNKAQVMSKRLDLDIEHCGDDLYMLTYIGRNLKVTRQYVVDSDEKYFLAGETLAEVEQFRKDLYMAFFLKACESF